VRVLSYLKITFDEELVIAVVQGIVGELVETLKPRFWMAWQIDPNPNLVCVQFARLEKESTAIPLAKRNALVIAHSRGT
jgi:hypothetical protein